MKPNLICIFTLVAAIGFGLITRVFFAALPAAPGGAAMQSIDTVVINRWFFMALCRE